MTKFIIEAGSCHMNDFDLIKDYIHFCNKLNVSYLKFQLFPESMTGANIHLDPELFKKAFEYAQLKTPAVNIFASVWTKEDLDVLYNLGCRNVKFAYSQRNSKLIPEAVCKFSKTFVSYGILDKQNKHPNIIPMFCEPKYPVVELLDFDGIFEKFNTFSDHTIGIRQSMKALKFRPEYLEKHVRLLSDKIDCPDAKFAITPQEFIVLKNSMYC